MNTYTDLCNRIYLDKKKICLDLGNVLVHVNFDKFIDYLIKDIKAFSSMFGCTSFLRKIQQLHDLGIHDMEVIIDNYLPIKLSYVELLKFIDKWKECVIPSKPMLTAVEKLIDKDVEVALLSNIGSCHAAYLRNHPDCKDIFNRCIQHFSCEIGAVKPHRLFYQAFITDYPGWKYTIFLDDRQDNIKNCNPLIGILFDIKNFQTDEQAAETFTKLCEDIITGEISNKIGAAKRNGELIYL